MAVMRIKSFDLCLRKSDSVEWFIAAVGELKPCQLAVQPEGDGQLGPKALGHLRELGPGFLPLLLLMLREGRDFLLNCLFRAFDVLSDDAEYGGILRRRRCNRFRDVFLGDPHLIEPNFLLKQARSPHIQFSIDILDRMLERNLFPRIAVNEVAGQKVPIALYDVLNREPIR